MEAVHSSSRGWWWPIGGAIAAISLLHYLTADAETGRHVVFARLYFLPVAFAALAYGLRGGLAAGAVVVLVYAPLYAARADRYTQPVGLVLDLLVLVGVGALVGWRVDRERRLHLRAMRAEHLAALGEASAVMAHEIKRPLVTIGGFIRRVLKRSTAEEDRHDLELVATEVQRLERLVHSALDYAGGRVPQMDRLPVWQALDRALSIMQPEAERNDVKISLRVSGLDGRDLWCDGDQVQQVLINLLDNAVHHVPDGGWVRVTASPDRKDGVAFEVRDSGPGIPESLLNVLFEPFAGQRRGGTGLGLAIARRIVEQHGGRIEADNHPDGGAVLTVRLPTRGMGDPGEETTS